MTPDPAVQVLLVEDNPGDAVLIQATLDASRWEFDVVHCGRLQDAIAAVEDRRFDVALLDLGLPDSSGHATYATLNAAAPGLPVVVLTGLDDDETADAALRAGAQDYLVKGGSAEESVARAIRNAIERQHLAASVDRHDQQRSALVELGRVALAGASAADLAQRTADLVAAALEVEFATVADHDRDRGVLICRGTHGHGRADGEAVEIPADGTTLGGICLDQDRAVLVDDLGSAEIAVGDRFRERGLRSGVCVPITESGGATGVVAALSRSPGRFEAGDIEFLEAVANLLSEAQRRRASEAALQERVKERGALYAVTRALVEHDDQAATAAAVAAALVSGMSRPQEAIAVVTIDGLEVSSDPDQSPAVELVAPIETDGVRRGSLRIGYRQPRPLLSDEQQLLDDAARTVGLWLERDDALRAARSREAYLANLLTQIPGMTWTFDRQLRLRSARGMRLTELGLAEEDLVGRTLADVLAIDNRDGAIAAHEAALGGTPKSYRYTAGGKHWQAYVEPLTSADGEIEGVVGSSIDITDAVRTQRQLLEHQQRMSAILEQLPIGVWTTDSQLRFTSVLGSVVNDLGQVPDDIVGKELREYFGDDPAAEEPTAAHRSALTGEGASARFEWRGIVFQIRVEPLRDGDGRIIGTAGVGLDVTDLHRAQREVERREQRFSALVEHAPDVVTILDHDGKLLYSSPAVQRMCGWSAEEYAELDPWGLLHPDDRELATRFWRQVLATDETLGPVNFRIRDRFGRYRFVEAVYTNRLDDPAVGGVICNIRDVTVQREAERSLRESEERFRRLADNAPDIIFRMSLNPDARVEYVSPAVEALTGYAVDEWYEDPDLAFELFSPEDHDVVHRARAGEIGREPLQVELRHKDGHTVWFEIRFVPVVQADGEVVGMEGVARDISQSKLAEKTLRDALAREQQAARDLRQLDAMKNGFLQAVSHELRTPLTAVVGFSALLEHRDRLDDDRYQHLVSRLGANANRLQRLLTDLLDVDRMSRASLEPRRITGDVRDLVSRVAEEMIEEGLLVRVHGEPTIASIDAAKTERIVENLLRNAGKHAPGSPIEVTVGQTPEGLLITVEDRGPGVPDTLKTAVFEAFRHGDTEASKVGGLGIGLSVVQTFAKLHGGRAWVEDRPGGGASFRVLLPDSDPSVGGEHVDLRDELAHHVLGEQLAETSEVARVDDRVPLVDGAHRGFHGTGGGDGI